MNPKVRFAIASALMILAFISFFHIDSYEADTYKINPVFWIAGIALAAVSLWNFYIIIKQSGRGPEN